MVVIANIKTVAGKDWVEHTFACDTHHEYADQLLELGVEEIEVRTTDGCRSPNGIANHLGIKVKNPRIAPNKWGW